MSISSLVRRRKAVPDRRPHWQDIPEEPDEEDGEGYDRLGMMMKIDTLERPWRDLINEHGFTPVVKCWQATNDPAVAGQMLRRRHEARQHETATARY